MATPISRRSLLQVGLVAGAGVESALAAPGGSAASPTPRQIEGPFYPVKDQADKDFDLTRVAGAGGRAAGETVVVAGHIRGADGQPLANAVVDIWQANTHGRYDHERDPNPAPLDPNFQGRAIITSDTEGAFRFKTIIPGAYPATSDWTRPPHIHFKVSLRGYREIVTQMYFDGQPLNEPDRLLSAVPEDQRASLVAKPEPLESDADTRTLYRFDVVLAKA